MDQCITKWLYTLDTCSILCCNNPQSNPLFYQSNGPCNEIMSVWSMFVYNISSKGHEQMSILQ